VPIDVGEIAAKSFDIGVVADPIEPFEHDRRLGALLPGGRQRRLDVLERPAGRARHRLGHLHAGDCIPGDIDAPAENGLAPLGEDGDETADIGNGDLLELPLRRQRHGKPALGKGADRPRCQKVVHEGDRRADRIGQIRCRQTLLDGELAVEVGDAGVPVGSGDRCVDDVPDAGIREPCDGRQPPA
jgi:hypothetical protein